MIREGRAWVFGDDVDTDVIIPARYLNSSDPQHLAAHCLEDLDENFASKVAEGDVVIAGRNFGCGSSREHAPLALKATGISGVVAISFARIFFRNALNIGLPIWECPELVAEAEPGDRIKINIEEGVFEIVDKGKSFSAPPFPPFMQQLINEGGLVNYVRKKLSEA